MSTPGPGAGGTGGKNAPTKSFKPKAPKPKSRTAVEPSKGDDLDSFDLLQDAQKKAKKKAKDREGKEGDGKGRGQRSGGAASSSGPAGASSSAASGPAKSAAGDRSRRAAMPDSEEEWSEEEAKGAEEVGGPIQVPFSGNEASLTMAAAAAAAVANALPPSTATTEAPILQKHLEEGFFLLQLPTELPFRTAFDDGLRPQLARRLTELPNPGYAGRLRFHRSGRVTLAMGELVFEVFRGTEVMSPQELVAIFNKEAHRLGPVNRRFVATL